tara:strand:- start:63 stop:734 length:672 start_codon:yes stop_codon:yes gene_type:complete
MIVFEIEGSSLRVLSGKTILMLMPLKNIALNSLELFNDPPTATLYNLNVGQNEVLLSQPLDNIQNSDGLTFTPITFLAFASLNFGVDSMVDVTSTSTIGLSGTNVFSLINSREGIGGNSGVLKTRHGVLYGFSFTNLVVEKPSIIFVSFFDSNNVEEFFRPIMQIAVPYATGGSFISESFPLGIDFRTAIGYAITLEPWNPKGIPNPPEDNSLAMTITYDSIA